ncbi:hypothetical protein Sjap_018411 [Stephania japonica]|uniref:RNase H type-1 domain-containing protein n=1 Tax=Stephania japonica TaxID=461633 RepID=A0AAP0NN53_9MAGN
MTRGTAGDLAMFVMVSHSPGVSQSAEYLKHENIRVVHKQAPDSGCLKFNTDASVVNGSDFFSVGGVVRDHQGMVVGAFTRRIPGQVEPKVAEAVAVREGVVFAHTHGFFCDVTSLSLESGLKQVDGCWSRPNWGVGDKILELRILPPELDSAISRLVNCLRVLGIDFRGRVELRESVLAWFEYVAINKRKPHTRTHSVLIRPVKCIINQLPRTNNIPRSVLSCPDSLINSRTSTIEIHRQVRGKRTYLVTTSELLLEPTPLLLLSIRVSNKKMNDRLKEMCSHWKSHYRPKYN